MDNLYCDFILFICIGVLFIISFLICYMIINITLNILEKMTGIRLEDHFLNWDDKSL